MLRYALPTALAAALWTAALAPSQAQDKTDPKKPTATPQTAPKPNTPPVAQTPIVPPRPSDPNIVGSVNGKNIMFADVVDRLRKENPDVFKQIAGQAAGAVAADQLFGAEPKPSVTITSEQVMAQLRDKNNPALYQVLQLMLREQAIAQTAAKENVVVTDAQVNEFISKRIAELRKSGQVPPKMSDDEFLAAQKQSRPILIDRLRTQIQMTKLMDKDPVLQKDLQDNAAKLVGHAVTPADFLRARHILVAAPPDHNDTAAPVDPSGNAASPLSPDEIKAAKAANVVALAKINKIAADIKSGKKTFEAEAQENSDDTGSKPTGGDLGVFLRGTMVKEFDKAAFAAKPGEIIGPIKTQFGYHLIKVEKQGKDLTPEERQDALAVFNQRYQSQHPQLLSSFMQNLMEKKAQVASYMTPPPTPQPGFPGGPQGG